jgi:NADPH:quinone reductase-like Zn-dependent oxidoreductase
MAAKPPEQGAIPLTMRAWTFTNTGRPADVLTFTNNHPLQSTLKPNEVLVKISHCGFNAGVDLIMQIVPHWLHNSPAIPELDLSGIIVATASPRTDLQVGTKVFGSTSPMAFFLSGKGSLAEYIVVSADLIMPIPSNMPLEQACGLSGCGCTAVQIVRKANIKPGDSVFINGGSGGLGSITVQVVKAAVGPSGRVTATCSTPKLSFVKSLGADEVVDYTAHPSLAAHVAKTYASTRFDAVIDTVGIQELYTASPAFLKPSGLYLNVGGQTVPKRLGSFLGMMWVMLMNYMYPSFLPKGVPRRYAFLSGRATREDHAEVKRLVEEGKLVVPLDSVWEMGEALKAYGVIGSQRAKGKVVVHVQDV